MWAPQRFFRDRARITTSYKVKWWTHLGRLDGLTTRERRMTIRADARSLHARPWERRYRHAFMEVVRPVDFKLWAGRGELSFFFTRSPGGHPGEPVGKIEDAPILNPRWEMQGESLTASRSSPARESACAVSCLVSQWSASALQGRRASRAGRGVFV